MTYFLFFSKEFAFISHLQYIQKIQLGLLSSLLQNNVADKYIELVHNTSSALLTHHVTKKKKGGKKAIVCFHLKSLGDKHIT